MSGPALRRGIGGACLCGCCAKPSDSSGRSAVRSVRVFHCATIDESLQGVRKIFSTARERAEKFFRAGGASGNRNESGVRARLATCIDTLSHFVAGTPLTGLLAGVKSATRMIDLVLCCRETARHRSIGWKCGRRELRCGTVGSRVGLFSTFRAGFPSGWRRSRCRRVATTETRSARDTRRRKQDVVMEDSQIAAALSTQLAARIGASGYELWFGPSTRICVTSTCLTILAASDVCARLAADELCGRHSRVLGGDRGPAGSDCV